MPNFFTMVGLFGAICSVFYLDWLIYRDFYVNLYFDSVLHSWKELRDIAEFQIKTHDNQRQHRDRIQLPASETECLYPFIHRLAKGWYRIHHCVLRRWHESGTICSHFRRKIWLSERPHTIFRRHHTGCGTIGDVSPKVNNGGLKRLHAQADYFSFFSSNSTPSQK